MVTTFTPLCIRSDMVMPLQAVQPYVFENKARVMPHARRKFRRKFARRTRRFRRFRRRRRAVVHAPELKVEDFLASALNVSTTAAPVINMINIANGTGSAQRIGNIILIKSISVTFNWAFDQASVVEAVWHRVVIMIDRQTEFASLPGTTDVYENPTDPESFREKATAGRFRTLWGRSFFMDHRNRQFKVLTATVRFPRGLKVRYAGLNGGDFQKNLVFFISQADVPLGTATTLNARIRVRYTDS